MRSEHPQRLSPLGLALLAAACLSGCPADDAAKPKPKPAKHKAETHSYLPPATYEPAAQSSGETETSETGETRSAVEAPATLGAEDVADAIESAAATGDAVEVVASTPTQDPVELAVRWAASRIVQVEVEAVPAHAGSDLPAARATGLGFVTADRTVTLPLAITEPARFHDGWPDAYPDGLHTLFRVSGWNARTGLLLLLFSSEKTNVSYIPLRRETTALPTALRTLRISSSPAPRRVHEEVLAPGTPLLVVGFREEEAGPTPCGLAATVLGDASGDEFLVQVDADHGATLVGAPAVFTRTDGKHAVVGLVVADEAGSLRIARFRE